MMSTQFVPSDMFRSTGHLCLCRRDKGRPPRLRVLRREPGPALEGSHWVIAAAALGGGFEEAGEDIIDAWYMVWMA